MDWEEFVEQMALVTVQRSPSPSNEPDSLSSVSERWAVELSLSFYAKRFAALDILDTIISIPVDSWFWTCLAGHQLAVIIIVNTKKVRIFSVMIIEDVFVVNSRSFLW